jgi:hypothetical protein
MAQFTPKYKLGYFQKGDKTNAELESNRWRTIDAQMYALFDVMGNGVITGWDFIFQDLNSNILSISIGSGHVGHVAVESIEIQTTTLSPNSVNYIYATSDNSSYYTKDVAFTSTTVPTLLDNYLFIGTVTTGNTGDVPFILSNDVSERQYISYKQQIINLIKGHRHIGGTDNPSKINLSTDVQGYLSPYNLEDLDASIVLSGVLDFARIPQLDHTELLNIGVLTHPQLDTFVQILSNEGQRIMGEVSSVNLLKMVLAVKHVYPEIDDYLVNELAFIPGISPDDVVDQTNTTADVDYRPSSEGGTHTIKGSSAESVSIFTKGWNSSGELAEGVLSSLVLVGDSLTLVTTENKVYIEDFVNVDDWQTVVTDLSAISSSFVVDTIMTSGSAASGNLNVSSQGAEVAFVLKKTFTAQSWESYNKISFQFFCDDATHGDVYFFIYDAVAGSQNSYTMILERNAPTIQQDNGAIGWREMIIDVSKYTRSNITGIGFYTSTTAGWIVNDPLNFHVDSMILTAGNSFVKRGTAVYKYGNDFQYNFSDVRWTASLPEDTSVLVRTRVSDMEDMSDAAWSPYIVESGGLITLPSAGVYKYIELEVTLEGLGSTSPQFYALYLDSTVVNDNKTFEFNTKDAWDTGTLSNIDTQTTPGSIRIKSVSDLGNYVYSADGKIVQLNSDFSEKLSVYGDNMPRSFVQMLSGQPSGFGQISAVEIGLRDSYIIADTDNDRVLEIDKTGTILWGLMGTFVSTPANPYVSVTVTTSGSSSSLKQFSAVGCYYNIEDQMLSVMFNDYLENIYTSSTFAINKMYLKSGTKRIYFDSTKNISSLFGVTNEFYGQSVSDNTFLAGSNVLQIKMYEADAVTLSAIASSQDPYLVLVSPKINEIVLSNTVSIEFASYNCVISNEYYAIRVQIDGGASVDYYTTEPIVLTGLSDGIHTVYAVLVDYNGNELANAEAKILQKFDISTGIFSDTAISILSISQNQIVSTGNFTVDFLTYNLPPGYGVRYTVDDGQYYTHDSADPIQFSNLLVGVHALRFYIADSNNVALSGDLVDVTVSMAVSTREAGSFNLVIGSGAIQSKSSSALVDTVLPIETTVVRFANIYSPIDVQLISSDSVAGDVSEFNVLVTKPATSSNLNYFNSVYKDGYSVVEYNSLGSLVISDNTAIIASGKEYAKTYLGGARKYGGNELFIADPYGRRAIIVEKNLSTGLSSVVWQYDSDRIVSDFNRVPKNDGVVTISENSIDTSNFYVRRDSVVTWYNNTSETIRVLSGSTGYEQFYADPDFDLFGRDFDSGDILPGQYYSFSFLNIGVYDYFVYPYIYTAKISCMETSVVPDDEFVLVENDPSNGSYLNRIIRIDSLGNVIWEFGQSYVSFIKDAKPVSESEIVITV